METIEERLFKRIDKYHSVAYLGEELHPGSPFWDDKDLLDTSPMVKDGTFPHWQDGLETLTYIDDNYTYILNQVFCGDSHTAPTHLGVVIRLDKVVEEEE